jgi:hypothetical protein
MAPTVAPARAGASATVVRPPAVGRYVRRPLLVAAGLLVLVLASIVFDQLHARHLDRGFDQGFDVEGVVADDYGGGERVPVAYENPLVGPTEAYASRWDSPRPEPGATVDLEVNRDNPRRVVLSGARYAPRPTPAYFVAPLIPVGFHLARRRRISRLERLVAASTETKAGTKAGTEAGTRTGEPTKLLGTLTPWGRGRRSVALNLFAADAGRGDRALCVVRLFSAEGLPVGGPAFDVEVHGTARPLRTVVAKVGTQVLWPRGRTMGRGQQRRTARVVPPTTYRRIKVDRDALPPHPPWWRATRLALGACLAGLVVASIATGVILGHRAGSEDFERNGVQVVAQVLEVDPVGNRAAVAYDPPDGGEPVIAIVPTNVGDGIAVATSYPAAVDPDDPEHVRLRASSYDAATPLTMVWIGVAGLGLVLAWRVLRWRQAKAAATQGPWLRAEAWLMERGPFGREVDVVLAPPGSRHPSCTLRMRKAVAMSETVPLSSSRQRVRVAGTPSPGQAMVLVVADALVHPPRSPKAPRRIEE